MVSTHERLSQLYMYYCTNEICTGYHRRDKPIPVLPGDDHAEIYFLHTSILMTSRLYLCNYIISATIINITHVLMKGYMTISDDHNILDQVSRIH